MSKLIPVPLGPESDPARSKYVGSPTIYNGFIEASQQGKVKFAIHADPGLISFTTFANEGSIRGGIVLGSVAYIVAGETLYKVTSDGTKTTIGDVIGTRSVIIARNAAAAPEIIIVADSTVYHLVSDVLQVHPDGDLPASLVVSVASLGHRIVYLLSDGRFFWSDVNDADAVQALNFKTAEARPDAGVRNIVLGSMMWVMGEETTEVFGLSTDTSDPFPRIQGVLLEHGTRSKHAVCAGDNSLIWPSHKAVIVRASGFSAKVISTGAVNRDLQAAIDAQTAAEIEAFVWTEGGHEFYQISSSDWTWVHDFSTKRWHKKDSQGESRSKIRHYFRAFDQHIVGDFESATLYKMRMDAYDEAGDELVMRIVTPIMDEQGYYIIWDGLQIDMELGVGDASADSASDEFNPKASLRWSDDGGNNWSPWRERPLGQQGNYKGRVSYSQLGMSKEQGRMFELSISAGVKKVALQARARVRLMPAQGMAA